MARTILDRQLTAGRPTAAPFALAAHPDDADIRRLLRENPMPGRIALTLEREPDYFADTDWPGTDKQSIIAREGGRAVCVGSCVTRQRFVNGKPCRVGYLGGLRLDAATGGRFDILRRGYEFFREQQAGNPADYYFTSIAADNVAARRFLERGLPGMPAYEFFGEFITLLVSAKSWLPKRPVREAESTGLTEITRFLNERGSDYQFAACWAEGELAALQSLNLKARDFQVATHDGRLSGCAALWDQRIFKQTVIRRYTPWLARMRPVLNLAARIVAAPCLPAVGSTLAHAFVSPLAVEPENLELLAPLIARLQRCAASRGLECLTLGFAADDPRYSVLRNKVSGREYRSRIYLVRWPGIGGSVQTLDGRRLGPEVALL